MIEIEHLCKKYGDRAAVDDLNLTIEDGRIYGFLGPNGAGKSTTMNILTGFLDATSGKVTVEGHDIVKESLAAKKCIGYLPEQPPLYPDMTVLEYLKFAAELKGLGKEKRKQLIGEAMEKTEITDVKNRLIRHLSKGYRQRVGFAQAILGYPKIIILDEPSVGLDPKQIISTRDLIRELGKEHTVILSSHILTEISAVCDHVFILSHGKLVASDSTERLIDMMSGAQQLMLVVKGDAERLVPLLEELSHVERVEVLEPQEEGTSLLRVVAEKNQDLREAVFRQVSGSGVTLLEMRAIVKSLEDVFLELTQEGGADE